MNSKIKIAQEITYGCESQVKLLETKLAKLGVGFEKSAIQNELQAKLLPFVVSLQVSDYMQEFLCAPDSMKLLKFDNKKLEELEQFQMCCFDIDQYHQNLEKLRQMFTNSKKGICRINFYEDIALSII